ncbi:MAG: hypothetical protein B7Z37_02595 [Verrucomicrobia bacterium 12-59-8]|nr:MAG: hypothetical protein B7Z37_02595 [Verrucomicrobia bacterium 12-59-8]
MNSSPPADAVVADSKPHAEAEDCARDIRRCVYDMKQLAFVGRDRTPGKPMAGCRNTVGRVKCWGAFGALWGGIWGWLFGSTFFQNEGAGPLMVAEPLAGWIVGALEGAVIGGGLIAIGACLYSLASQRTAS